MYEKELRDSASHLQSMNSFYENLKFTMNNFNESLDDSKAFKDEVNKLAKNLNALNAVYGNMLSAMNQPRV
jgi:gliding motility-associated protein GldL